MNALMSDGKSHLDWTEKAMEDTIDFYQVLNEKEKYLAVVKDFLENEENGSAISSRKDKALRWAVEKGDVEIVKYLVESGDTTQNEYDKALRLAYAHGKLSVVKYLQSKMSEKS